MSTPSKDQSQPSPFAGFGAAASGQKSDQPNPFAGFASLANSGSLLFGNTSSTPTFSFNASTFGTASNKKDENSGDKKDDDDEDDEGEDGDDGGNVADESHAADFKPIVELTPVVFKSYEEEEDIMFKTRAKLFKFVKEDTYGGEVRTNYWKERGLGDIKVLKHKTTGECRLLMHTEKTLKICLNHKIAPITELLPMQGSDGKAWTFSALDFADEELKQDTFALKMASADIAKEFKKAFDNARELNKAKKGGSSDSASAAAPSSPAKEAPAALAATPAQPQSPEKPAAAAPAPSAPATVDAVAKDVSKLNVQAPAQPAIAGGWQKRDPEDPEVKNVAKFACEKIGKGSLVRVASVKSQVVAGMNFRLALHIKHSDGQVFAHVVTVFQPLPHTKEPLSLKEHLQTGKVA